MKYFSLTKAPKTYDVFDGVKVNVFFNQVVDNVNVFFNNVANDVNVFFNNVVDDDDIVWIKTTFLRVEIKEEQLLNGQKWEAHNGFFYPLNWHRNQLVKSPRDYLALQVMIAKEELKK